MAKLTDFGIARSIDATHGLTMAGQIVGTAAYLSPEQAKGQPVTAASDVYSVGAVLFEMIAGRPPFAADTAMATALMHVDDPVPDVRALRRDASPAIAAVIARAMAKRPADRYPSAAAMAAELTDDADATLVVAARPGRRRASRSAVLAALLACLAVLAGAGAWALSGWGDDPHAAASPPKTTAKPKLTSIPAALVGLQYVTAARRLKAAGLTPVRTIGPYDDNAKDSVISVSRSGQVPEGATVTLTVSSGPAPPPPPEDKGHKHHHEHRGHGNGNQGGDEG